MIYEYLVKEDIYLIQTELPDGVNGFCKDVCPYSFAVVEQRLDDEAKRKAAEHENRHLQNGDLYKDFDELEEK